MKTRTTILPYTAAQQNKNGYSYSFGAYDNIVKAINANYKRTVGRLGTSHDPIDLMEVSHVVYDAALENGSVVATIETLETSNGIMLTQLLADDAVVFRPTGSGTIRDSVVLDDFELVAVDAISRDEDSFIKFQ